MSSREVSFFGLSVKTIVVHTLTYFLVGLIASTVFNYAELFTQTQLSSFMRPVEEPIVALGPALQFIRGILFATAFYPLREILFGRKNGWLFIWLLLVTLGILSTFGPSPGSVEGVIYTTLPIAEQFSGGFLEVLTQSFLLSAVLFYWVNNPDKRWLNWLLWILYALVLFMSVAGYFFLLGGS
ncbi:MAG: hypothetical protein DWQ07_20690 [Chloroflexi bacterium]|nr:MAG: hypothetical protein DWQ07_20690 [Chloroflexota bacterium]MBL1194502.1 hypothetical protein [Chloroflexota bacterium]NOH11790.1 hypothetical protein [Chloroflexota bacterium]